MQREEIFCEHKKKFVFVDESFKRRLFLTLLPIGIESLEIYIQSSVRGRKVLMMIG
jgi:hypothetical protein